MTDLIIDEVPLPTTIINKINYAIENDIMISNNLDLFRNVKLKSFNESEVDRISKRFIEYLSYCDQRKWSKNNVKSNLISFKCSKNGSSHAIADNSSRKNKSLKCNCTQQE